MSLVVATEAAKVRRLAGSPDTTMLSDADLTAYFNEDALDWINRRVPSRTIDNFTTVAGQQDYDEKPSNAYRVTKVWWLNASWLTFSPTMKVIPGALDIDNMMKGFQVMSNPAIVQAFYKSIEYYHDFFRGKGKETANGLIRLIPVATSTGDCVFFEYTSAKYAAITGTDAQYVEGVRFYVASLVLENLAIRRGVVTSGRGWSGGAGRNEERRAKELLLKAEGLVVGKGFFGARG